MRSGISSVELKQLYQHRRIPNLKIPLFYGIWIALGIIAWNSSHWALTWLCYLGMGYIQMGIVTFMHDCTHSTLFKARWKNWAFGIFAMIPLIISFTSFKEDHLIHHRYNRTSKDPDAFAMGERGVGDFILFYAYATVGVFLTAIQFTLIFPLKVLRGKKALIHWGEIALHIVVMWAVFDWAASQGIANQLFSVWFWPLIFFGFFNSMRFIAEHYGCPWDAGPLAGTRTIISNPMNSFFWNNINYHTGHHAYPGVPWYNLQKLHALLLPELERVGALIDRSYFAIFIHALWHGPETVATTKSRNSSSSKILH